MSKFKVIEGSNVVSIVARSRELRQLEQDLQKNLNRSNRDIFVYSYHFARLGHPLLAQKHLNNLLPGYFDSGIYKDLCQALLAWSVSQMNPAFKTPQNQKTYEFFIIVKQTLTLFNELNFSQKPAFLRFKREFLANSQTITAPSS